MIDSIHLRRKIPKEDLVNIKNKIMHPKDALKLKLVDSVGTFEEFVDVNFPNCSIEQIIYQVEGTRFRENHFYQR